MHLLPGLLGIVLEAGKELPPVGVHGGGIFQIPGIELLDELGIAAIEE